MNFIESLSAIVDCFSLSETYLQTSSIFFFETDDSPFKYFSSNRCIIRSGYRLIGDVK